MNTITHVLRVLCVLLAFPVAFYVGYVIANYALGWWTVWRLQRQWRRMIETLQGKRGRSRGE